MVGGFFDNFLKQDKSENNLRLVVSLLAFDFEYEGSVDVDLVAAHEAVVSVSGAHSSIVYALVFVSVSVCSHSSKCISSHDASLDSELIFSKLV